MKFSIPNDNEIIDQIIHSFSQYNLRDIKEINKFELDFTIAEFILCSCFIDQISGFRYNNDKVGERYGMFVQEYLPAYNAGELYTDLRNKLVHNYSVGAHYALTRRTPAVHFKKINGIIHLNLENFIADLEIALNKYTEQVRTNDDIRNNALNWYSTHNILSLVA